jgi:small-conductance mechanosensitive channel
MPTPGKLGRLPRDPSRPAPVFEDSLIAPASAAAPLPGELQQRDRQIEQLQGQAEKLESANDILRTSLADEREQKAQLLSSGQLTNPLLQTLMSAAAERRGAAESSGDGA